MGAVYALLDSEESIRYVGLTHGNAYFRLRTHINSARRGSQYPVHRWIRKHDYEVQVAVLEIDPPDILLAEQQWIADRRAAGDRLLNCTDGGEGTIGIEVSAETRAKMSLAAKRRGGRPMSEETKAKLSAAKRGRVHGPLSEEHKAKLAAAQRGKKMGAESRRKLSEARKGIVFSAEHRAKLSAAKIGNRNRSGGGPPPPEGGQLAWP